MAQLDKEPWEKKDIWDQKPPLGTRLFIGLLRAVGGAASLFGRRSGGPRQATTLSFGFGGPHITRETVPEGQTFSFRILSVQEVKGRGTAVAGMISRGEVHSGDTVTCVTTDGKRFPCVVREVERPVPANLHPSGTKPLPFCTIFVLDHGPEAFHPQDQFVIEK